MVPAALLESPRAFCQAAATALGGECPVGGGVASYVSSRFDPFLNQAFVAPGADPVTAARRLDGRPGFVWMEADATAGDERAMRVAGFRLAGFTAMEASSDDPAAAPDRDLPPLGPDQVAAWHAVYSEVLGADPRSIPDWQRLYDALGPAADGSLSLWLLASDGEPAAVAALFVDGRTAGLYCFGTRERFRRRGLAAALIAACRAHARRRQVGRCVLQATPAGRPLYAASGFAAVATLQIFVRR